MPTPTGNTPPIISPAESERDRGHDDYYCRYLFLHSLFPENELDKEKKVIIEEIAMYKDDPCLKSV